MGHGIAGPQPGRSSHHNPTIIFVAQGAEVHSEVGEAKTSTHTEKTNVSTIFALACSPVKVCELESDLSDYTQPDATYILNGFKFGFPLHYTGPYLSFEAGNLKSALQNPDIVRQKINKELSEGRIGGPFLEPPCPGFRTSPIGLVEKKVVGDYRLIHHLSYPSGHSVNDYIDPGLCSVQYTRFDEAIRLVQCLGTGCYLGKSDIQSAFRLLPVSPNDFRLLGFHFDGKYYFDKCLPFGCSISCSTFEKFATFIEFCTRKRLMTGDLLHYLDDYLFGGKNKNECAHVMLEFTLCTTRLGVPIAVDKTEGPKQVLVFLGLEIDSIQMRIRIPLEKICEIIAKVNVLLSKSKCTLNQMQSLIGSLQFACRAIVPGRPFCRRLINSICGLTKKHHHIRISGSIRADLAMWKYFFSDFNGISVFYNQFWLYNSDLELFTDAAAKQGFGFGCYFGGKWAYGTWPDSWHARGWMEDITILEFFPLLVSLYLWGDHIRNKKITFRCDNQAVVHIINTMSSKSEGVMVLLRAFTLKCLKLNVLVKAIHISGSKNGLTDALSRLQIEKFRRLAPQADPDPGVIPSHLWDIFNLEPGNY